MDNVIAVEKEIMDRWDESDQGIVSSVDLSNESFQHPVKHLLIDKYLPDVCLRLGVVTLPCTCIPYNGLYRLKFADNDPILPLHLAIYHRIALASTKTQYSSWPRVAYIAHEQNAADTFVLMKEGRVSAITVRSGLFMPYEIIIYSCGRCDLQYMCKDRLLGHQHMLNLVAQMLDCT